MRYTEKQRLEVVRDYLSGTGGQKEVAQRHGVEPTSLRNWVAAYREHGIAGIAPRPKRPRYPADFKLMVLKRIKDESLSRRQAAAIFGIRKTDLITRWQRLYDSGGPNALVARPSQSTAMPTSNKPPPRPPKAKAKTREELLDEVQRLQAENAYLKKLKALVQSKSRSARGRKRQS